MAIVTFPVRLQYPLVQELLVSNVTVPFGDGYRQSINKNSAFVNYDKSGATPGRADGLGNTTTAYRGINRFTLNMRNLTHQNQTTRNQDLTVDSTKLINRLWRFYQDMYGSFQSFWFYSPNENTNDPATTAALVNGTDTLGRYLVMFEQDSLSRELVVRHLFNSTLTLIEVRD